MDQIMLELVVKAGVVHLFEHVEGRSLEKDGPTAATQCRQASGVVRQDG
jgi:hypothetical protein